MAGLDELHDCPIEGCGTPVVRTQLMCRRHWALVPAEQARELYAAWDRGRGAGSERHIAAMGAAIDAVREQVR